jgi:hypothetical protein
MTTVNGHMWPRDNGPDHLIDLVARGVQVDEVELLA